MLNFFKKKNVKTVILHIGMQKTGTTFIQNALYDNRELLKNKFSIDYLVGGDYLGNRFNAAHEVPYTILRSKKSKLKYQGDIESYLLGVKDVISSSSCKYIILSSEEFSFLRDEHIKKLKDILPLNVSLKVALYFREQSDFANSLFKQYKKVGRGFNAQEFLESHERFFNYYQISKMWGSVFGDNNIKVGIYEAPEKPECRLDTSSATAEECADQVIEYMRERGYI